jgi:predicted nucleotidyltransferase
MRKSQQSLNKNQHKPGGGRRTAGQGRHPPGMVRALPAEEDWHGQWAFLAPQLGWFRRSAFLLILVLGRNYQAQFHVRELARSLGYDPAMISRNLKQMEEAGLVTREERGNLVLYRAAMENVLLRQMKVWLSLLEIQDLTRELDTVATGVILYGSCARGEDTQESDIDLFIEATDKGRVEEILGTYREKIPRELSAIVNTPDESYRLKSENRVLYENIQRGISLKYVL